MSLLNNSGNDEGLTVGYNIIIYILIVITSYSHYNFYNLETLSLTIKDFHTDVFMG